jgi:hypothetical protein
MVDFGVSVTSAVFFKGCGSPSVFNLFYMLKINFFASYGKKVVLGRYLEGPGKSNNQNHYKISSSTFLTILSQM